MDQDTKQHSSHGGVYSGRIIGAVVEALDLSEGVLRERTARRFFDGQPVSEYNRREVFKALGEVLVKRGIVPAPPSLQGFDFSMSDFVVETVTLAAQRWDNLQATLQSRSSTMPGNNSAAYAFLRLLVVDLALRVSALLRLADLEPHPPAAPLWAQENGGGKLLRKLTKDAGLTRGQLAARIGTSPVAIDNWLDGKNRPTSENITNLAAVLARPAANITSSQLAEEIRRQFTFAHLADLIAPSIGRARVVLLSTALVRFVWQIAESTRILHRSAVEESAPAELIALGLGATHPSARSVLEKLAQTEADPDWKRDILAAASDWSISFQVAAMQADRPRLAAGLAQDAQDVSEGGTALSDTDQQARRQIEIAAGLERQRMIRGDFRLPGQLLESGLALRRSVVSQFPLSPNAHFQLGSFLGMAGKHLRNRNLIDEGITECKIAAGLLPNWDAPVVEPGIILANIGAFEEALNELDRGRERLSEATPHFLVNRGYVLMNLSRFAEALKDFEQVLQANPTYALASLHAAHCAFSLGDRQKGLRYAKIARRLGEPAAYRAWKEGEYSRRRKKGTNGLMGGV